MIHICWFSDHCSTSGLGEQLIFNLKDEGGTPSSSSSPCPFYTAVFSAVFDYWRFSQANLLCFGISLHQKRRGRSYVTEMALFLTLLMCMPYSLLDMHLLPGAQPKCKVHLLSPKEKRQIWKPHGCVCCEFWLLSLLQRHRQKSWGRTMHHKRNELKKMDCPLMFIKCCSAKDTGANITQQWGGSHLQMFSVNRDTVNTGSCV